MSTAAVQDERRSSVLRRVSLRPLIVPAVAVALVAAGCSKNAHPGTAASPGAPSGSTAPASPAPASSAVSSTPVSTPPAASSSAIPAGFRPGSVTFVSAQTGFVLGAAQCATDPCTMLATTADAGHTWAAVGTVPAPISGTATAVTRVRFADAQDGWAFDPQLWATHDGGHTWHQVSEPGQVFDVEASAGSAYALVASCAAAPCASGPALLRTPVGSDAWAPVAGLQLAPATSGGSIALHAKAVWLATTGQGVAHLIASPDGVSWHTLGDPCSTLGSPWVLAGAAPVTTTSLYLLCGGGAAAGSQEKRVLYSTDAGAHSAPTAADPPRGGDVQGIAAASAQVVMVTARSGASSGYRSADGGRTWNSALEQGDGGVGYFDVGFTTPTQGVAIYGNPGQVATKLLMTRDVGATWAPVSFQ